MLFFDHRKRGWRIKFSQFLPFHELLSINDDSTVNNRDESDIKMGGYKLFSFHKHALKMFTIRLFRRLRRLWECIAYCLQ